MRLRISRRRRGSDPLRGFWLVVVGLVLTGATLVADDREADKAKSPPAGGSSTDAPTPAEARLRSDVTFLAADAQEGRAPGTKGIEAAARHIADVFKGTGLKPAPGAPDYFQAFRIGGRAVLGNHQFLAFVGPEGKELEGTLATDFSPSAIGSGANLDKVPIVFAGYGITAKDDALKLDYDDYAGIDVKGKAVLIIRREPQQDKESSPFAGTRTTAYATFQHKATNAFQHGAAAVLLVNDLAGLKGGKDQLLPFAAAGTESTSTIPFVMLGRDFADKLLAAAGQPSLADFEKLIDQDLKPRSHELKEWKLTGRIAIERTSIDTKNVVGVLEGAGPHANETIVIGGHYDHLGRGGLTSGSMAFFSNDIHNGADDNASGTAMVMEMARRLTARRDPPPRRLVFMAFSGEERGLLGSQYYVEHPLFPLQSTVMMLNCDMVGRLNAENELTMIGTGTTPGIDALVTVLGKSAGLKIKTIAGMTDGFGGSDHQSFYAKDVPVLFAFTGVHQDYHRPSDDSDRINYRGMGRIADYLELILLDVIRRPERPELIKMAQQPRRPRAAGATTKASPDPARSGLSVTMGSMPDYEYTAGGMKLAGVRDDGPAAKAGLKAGDIIVSFGGKSIGTIQDYMESTRGFKPGDQVDVVVKRAGQDVKLKVTLEGRSGN
jgi:Peptidase family M28/PDZ domain/PA domain